MIDVFERPVVRRVAIAAVALSLFAGITAALTYDDSSIPTNGARLTAAQGALVTHSNGKPETVHGTTDLRAGDTVEATGGAITIELADGSTLEGRSANGDMSATKVEIASPIELLAGALLVVSDNGPTVDANGNLVHLAAQRAVAARIERGLAVSAAAYTGRIDVDSAGQERTVAALRQLDVAVIGRPPAVPRAIELNPADPWDLRFLGAPIDAGRTLDALSRTYSGSHATMTTALLTAALPKLADEPMLPSVFDQRCTTKPGETLVGAAIASLGKNGDFPTRWRNSFDFRCGADAGGAGWGVVALDEGVAADQVIAAVEQASGAGAGQQTEAQPQPTAPAGTATSPTTAPPQTSTGPTTTTTSPSNPIEIPPTTVPSILPPLTGPPTGGSPPPPVTGVPLLDGVIDTVGSLLGGLIH